MIIFHTFFKIIKKNIFSISIYFIIFAILTILFTGSNQDNAIQNFTETELSISVINEDTGSLGKTVKSYLNSIHHLVDLPNDKDILQDSLFYRNVDYILFIPYDFTDKMKEKDYKYILENVKLPDGSAGYFADAQLEQFLNTLSLYLESGYDEESASAHAISDMKKSVTVTLKELDKKNIWDKDGIYYYFQFLPYIFLSILVTGIGPILSVFQQEGLNKRNLCSSLSFRSKNFQLTLGSTIFAFACYLLFFILAVIMYSKALFTLNGLLCLINAFFALLFGMSIAFLSGMFARNPQIFNMISNTLGLSLSFLGGIFVPLSIMDENILKISQFLPTYWYSKANDLLSVSTDLKEVMPELIKSFGIQFGFALAIFAVTLFLVKIKKENA